MRFTGAALAQDLPGGEVGAFAELDVDFTARRQACRRFAQAGGEQVRGKGRIKKDQVEVSAWAAQVGQGILAQQAHAPSVQGSQVPGQRGDSSRIVLHHDDIIGAARGRFQSQRATAGEEIKAALPPQILAKPVEQGLAHAIRGGTQPRAIGDTQAPTLELAGYDSDLADLASPYGWAAVVWPPTMTTLNASGRMRARKALTMSAWLTASTLRV